MLQGEHSAILVTFIKLPFVIKTFVLSIFEWPFYTGFTVLYYELLISSQYSDEISLSLRIRCMDEKQCGSKIHNPYCFHPHNEFMSLSKNYLPFNQPSNVKL